MKQDFEKQRSEFVNLKLTCMSAKSVTMKREGGYVVLIVHNATVYTPSVADGNYGSDQKLQRMTTEKLSLNLDNASFVQVNDEILSADMFVQKFKAIPESKNRE